MLITAEQLQKGQTFQVRYEKRWSNKITVKQIIGLEFEISYLLVEATTGKTKLLKRSETVRVVA